MRSIESTGASAVVDSGSDEAEGRRAQLQQRGVELAAIEPAPIRLHASPNLATAYDTYHWLRERDFDIVHFPEWRGAAYCSLLAKHLGLAFFHTTFVIGTHSPTAWQIQGNQELFSRYEDLETSFGRFHTLVLEPRMDKTPPKGMFKRGSSVRVWISQDERHLPVRFEVEFKMGTGVATLVGPLSQLLVLPPDGGDLGLGRVLAGARLLGPPVDPNDVLVDLYPVVSPHRHGELREIGALFDCFHRLLLVLVWC